LGDTEIGMGRTKTAIDEYKKALDLGDHSYWIYANLAAAYALEGKMYEAKSHLAEARRINPKLTIKWFATHAYEMASKTEGWRKAGLPEE